MNSEAVMSSGRQSSSGMYPILDRTSSSSFDASNPRTVAEPTVGERMPSRILSSAVLPAPLAPTSPVLAAGMSKARTCNATMEPYARPRSRAEMMDVSPIRFPWSQIQRLEQSHQGRGAGTRDRPALSVITMPVRISPPPIRMPDSMCSPRRTTPPTLRLGEGEQHIGDEEVRDRHHETDLHRDAVRTTKALGGEQSDDEHWRQTNAESHDRSRTDVFPQCRPHGDAAGTPTDGGDDECDPSGAVHQMLSLIHISEPTRP